VKLSGPALFLLNLGGAGAYLMLASRGWRDPAEAGVIPVTGEPFLWAACLPVLALSLLINVVWCALLERRRLTGWPYFLTTSAIWIGAVAIDFTRH
jgi:hypothetical protein